MRGERWIRFYVGVPDDPKVQRLEPQVFRFWVNCLCIAGQNGGTIPPADDLAFRLREDGEKVGRWVRDLVEAGIFDDEDGALRPHNWEARQYASDTSTDRVRRFREKKQPKPSAPPPPKPSISALWLEAGFPEGPEQANAWWNNLVANHKNRNGNAAAYGRWMELVRVGQFKREPFEAWYRTQGEKWDGYTQWPNLDKILHDAEWRFPQVPVMATGRRRSAREEAIDLA